MIPAILQTRSRSHVDLSRLNISIILKAKPDNATRGRYFTLKGLESEGCFIRRIKTAMQIIAKANNVPILVILVAFSIGVRAATNEEMKPSKIVLFQGVL